MTKGYLAGRVQEMEDELVRVRQEMHQRRTTADFLFHYTQDKYRELEWEEIYAYFKGTVDRGRGKPIGVTFHWPSGENRGFARLFDDFLKEKQGK